MSLLQETFLDNRHVALHGPEVQQKLKRWDRINELTLAGGLIEKLHSILSTDTSQPLIFTNDNIYKVGVGIPIYRREVVFVSEKFHPGFVIELHDSVRPQPFEISFALNANASEESYSSFEEIDLAPTWQMRPNWWPQEYHQMDVSDLTNLVDLFLIKDSQNMTCLYRNGEFSDIKIQIPVDSDLSYMWLREKTRVSKFLSEVEKRNNSGTIQTNQKLP